MKLLELFLCFLQIGAFSIGGGYASIPLIQSIVLKKEWLSLQAFTDIITISQMTPGPLAVNTSTFVGIRIAGIPGAIVASIGCILTGVLLSIVAIRVFHRYASLPSIKLILLALRASSCGLILAASITLACTALSPSSSYHVLLPFCFLSVSFLLLRKYKANPILIILLSGILGIFVYP